MSHVMVWPRREVAASLDQQSLDLLLARDNNDWLFRAHHERIHRSILVGPCFHLFVACLQAQLVKISQYGDGGRPWRQAFG